MIARSGNDSCGRQRTQARLNEAADAADATRGLVWQGNCDVVYHPSQNNFGGLRSITIEYPTSNYPAKPPASFKRPNRKCPASVSATKLGLFPAGHFRLSHSVSPDVDIPRCAAWGARTAKQA